MIIQFVGNFTSLIKGEGVGSSFDNKIVGSWFGRTILG
jgi:hypothetical protein